MPPCPKSRPAELVDLPAEFQVAMSGDIAWASAGDNGSPDEMTADNQGAGSSGEEHSLLHQALANLMDRALLPLSVVRFGMDQWVALDDSPLLARLGSDDKRDSVLAAEDMDCFSLPPTPPYSSDANFSVEAAEFLNESAKHTNGRQAVVTGHLCRRSRQAISTNGLLVQTSMEAVDNIGISWIRKGIDLEPCDSRDPDGLSLIAHVRLAPYGIPAQIVSVPETHMGDNEDQVIRSWSRAFGYPKSLLAVRGADSALVYVTLATGEQPTLYPRRLVFLDNDRKAQAVSESENVNGLDNTGMASTRSHADDAVDNPPAPPNPMELNDARSEPEEGEEREDGEDEDGEIADPVEPAYDERVSVMDAEFDAIISQLRKENTQSVEQSLATIKDTMVGFQEELRVEEEEERKRKEKERLETLAAQRAANAAAQAAKRANSASKHDAAGPSGARKRQRSKSRDEGSKKSRKKNEPAVALPAKTTSSVNPPAPVAAPAPPVDQVPKPEVVANGAVGDINTADGGSSSADGLFGSLGDDMGLDLDMGMGMSGMGEIGGMGGMGIDMDMGMDSMSNGMFGVTDDDFSFFDTVPANQPSGIAASSPPAPQLPAQPAAGAVKTEFAPTNSYQSGIDLGALSTSASSSGIDGGSSLVSDSLAGRDLVDTAMGDSIDDLFGGDDDDDGMFDSFFGSSSTATAAATAVTATTEVPPVTASEATVKLEADTTALVSQPTDTPDPLTISLVSPHEGLLADNISMTGASSGTAPESTTTAVSAADLASPGSYKLTPAPSADMQTPAQTPHVPFPSKSAESADETVLSRVSNSAVVQGYSTMQATAGIQAPSLQAALPSSTQAAAPLVQKQGTTPLPYSSIATPYDDIGRHAQSWLQDRPTPARLAGDINDMHPQELDPHNIRFTSIMEKSLNPVSWIKRISARRIHHTGRAKGQEPGVPPRRHSSGYWQAPDSRRIDTT
ncbi:hypothetical protein DL89DRAFT_257092 [Linderina pennispora]|uniref:Uncharacterized protein n=1 Tax=Linderina pennispora TaxID=61395 RepID=A0A1Y1WBW0_9FUNG|nr:uncharacterized protein DL89DRAFT_257092 [Linderina pennispora]ORX70922.1 hypothetical protein DL89DRAFT_257092 [Linderina pennispora]